MNSETMLACGKHPFVAREVLVMGAADPDKLETRMAQLLKVVAALAVADKNLSEGAQLLDRLGIDRTLIAAIYDTSPNSVSAVLSQARKKVKSVKSTGSRKKTEVTA
jgi:hypothetical protein